MLLLSFLVIMRKRDERGAPTLGPMPPDRMTLGRMAFSKGNDTFDGAHIRMTLSKQHFKMTLTNKSLSRKTHNKNALSRMTFGRMTFKKHQEK
jgi:hypothetical protein